MSSPGRGRSGVGEGTSGRPEGRQDGPVRDRLAEAGIRYTRGRETVVRALRRSSGPQSVAELHESLRREVPLSSLYRTLSVLEDSGVVVTHHAAPGVTRYELAEWLTGHHHHLVCRDCGTVEDVPLDPSHERRLAGLADEVAHDAGFLPMGHSLEIEGVCRSCR